MIIVDQVIWFGWSSSSFTLKKLECLKQSLWILYRLAWDNKIGFIYNIYWFNINR